MPKKGWLLGFTMLVAGCANRSPDDLNEFVHGKLGHQRVLGDEIVQEGQFTVRFPNRPEHQIKVRATHSIVKGEGDTELELTDLTEGTVTAFGLIDEAATGVLTSPDGTVLSATYNEDESITVNGESFATPEEASDALFLSPDAEAVTPEALAVVSTLLDEEDGDTGLITERGSVKKLVKTIWKKISSRGVCIKVKQDFFSDGSSSATASTSVGTCS